MPRPHTPKSNRTSPRIAGPLCWPMLALALLASLPVAAQQAKEPEQTPPPKAAPPSAPTRFVVNVNRVMVPVLVRDKQGRPVVDLKREDFQVFDNGKPQLISRFTVERRAPPASDTASGNQPPVRSQAAPPAALLPDRITVLLFDDLHLGIEELVHAKAAAIKVLPTLVSGSDMAAIVTTSGRLNSGLTRDRPKLEAAINSLKSRGQVRSGSHDCPTLDYYQADLILNKRDPDALQEAMGQVAQCDPKILPSTAESLVNSTARRVLVASEQDVQATNSATAEFVRRIANLPGQHTLILVSSGYLNLEQESLTAQSRIIDLATRANITISALDARGLYTTELTASDNVANRPLLTVADYRRSTMSLAEGPMSELAAGTGGTFFHNSNDLAAGFKALTELPECRYILELSLDNQKPDGAYHRLKVTVDRDGLDLQSRRGYYMPQPTKAAK